MRKAFVLLLAASALLAGCGSDKKSGNELVWCIGPSEKLTPAFKREYPELHMTKASCDLWK